MNSIKVALVFFICFCAQNIPLSGQGHVVKHAEIEAHLNRCLVLLGSTPVSTVNASIEADQDSLNSKVSEKFKKETTALTNKLTNFSTNLAVPQRSALEDCIRLAKNAIAERYEILITAEEGTVLLEKFKATFNEASPTPSDIALGEEIQNLSHRVGRLNESFKVRVSEFRDTVQELLPVILGDVPPINAGVLSQDINIEVDKLHIKKLIQSAFESTLISTPEEFTLSINSQSPSESSSSRAIALHNMRLIKIERETAGRQLVLMSKFLDAFPNKIAKSKEKSWGSLKQKFEKVIEACEANHFSEVSSLLDQLLQQVDKFLAK